MNALPILALLAVAPPAEETRFSRHVVPLFSRLGCNAGTCHGAVKGQNGFRLSLFGAEPAGDLERLLRDGNGRRLDRTDPDNSLLLLKATGQAVHQGGRRMVKGSAEYRLVRDWIAAGARLDTVEASRVTRLTVSPAQKTTRPGERYLLRVTAAFADGTTEDVTAYCTFEAVSREVASVEASGHVLTLGVGDTAVIARYRGEPVVAQLVVPREGKEPFPMVAPVNFIDHHILDKLRRLNI